MLTIENTFGKFRSPEDFYEINRDALDDTFGDNINFSRDVLRFENYKGEIVGFTGVTNYSGRAKTWRINYCILPQYIESSLPQLVVKESISLAKKSNKSEVYFTSRGNESLIEPILLDMGYKPIHYVFGMQIIDAKEKSIPSIKKPKGIFVEHVQKIDDYTQYAIIQNEAFQGFFENKYQTPKEIKQRFELQSKYFNINMFLAKDDNQLVGYAALLTWKNKDICFGKSLAVHPKYHKRGIGSYIIYKVLKFLQEENIHEYRFHVDGENFHAMDLYKKFGFVEFEKITVKFFKIK
jgi:L-phenylalanine/L-methionine N-acetyltransferase